MDKKDFVGTFNDWHERHKRLQISAQFIYMERTPYMSHRQRNVYSKALDDRLTHLFFRSMGLFSVWVG